MSLEQGLIVIKSNYEVANLVETDTEVIIKTYANIQGAERTVLIREGWVIQDDNTVVFTKDVVDVDDFQLLPTKEDELVQKPPPDQPDSTEIE